MTAIPALPPELEARYEARGRLGAGAMGVVVEALDRDIDRRVAIKLVRRPGADDTEAQENHARFRREAQAAGRLAHPNIVGVYDYGENADCAWIVMELVEGATLKSYLDRGERFPLAGLVKLMNQVLGALAYSHSRGVVHRDIKPANIMLADDGTGGPLVKIADFGIARLENSSFTQVGTVIGTPAYMAPEQIRGETVDSRADLWAAGVVLYQLLTGDKPFEGGANAVMHKVLHSEPLPPSQLAVTVPRAFDHVIARALAKRPADRFTTAADFAVAVRGAASEATVASGMLAAPAEDDSRALPPAFVPAPSAAPRRLPWALLGVAGVAVLALGWLGFGPGPAPPSQARQELVPTPPQGRPRPPPALPPPDFRAAAQAINGLPCTLLRAEASEAGLRLAGLARRDQEAELRNALSAARVPEAAVQGRVTYVEGPYCETLDLLRGRAAGAPRGALLGEAPLAKGDQLLFELAMPEAGGVLSVAYVMSSGTVAQLVPSRPQPGGEARRFGDPRPGWPGWVVDEPFGTDLLVAVAAERPLFAKPRPAQEPLAAWLAALGTALRQADAEGNRVGALVLPVATREAR